jgi:hypothetical protein
MGNRRWKGLWDLLLPQLASRFIAAWLYNSTGRSVLLVGLFHCAHNVTAVEFSREFIPGPRDELFIFTSMVVIIFGTVVAIATKGRLASGRNEVDGGSWSVANPG